MVPGRVDELWHDDAARRAQIVIERFFAYRDLARLVLIGFILMAACTFIPIYCGALVSGRSWPSRTVGLCLVVVCSALAYCVTRIPNVAQVERAVRRFAKRNRGLVDVGDFSQLRRLPVSHVRFIAELLVKDGVAVVVREGDCFQLVEE